MRPRIPAPALGAAHAVPDPDDGWHEVCAAVEVGAALPKRVTIAGVAVLLCREGGQVFAVSELCPHKNESMAYGMVFGGSLTCPHHQYRFDLRTGACNMRRCPPVDTWPVLLHNGRVHVQLHRTPEPS